MNAVDRVGRLPNRMPGLYHGLKLGAGWSDSCCVIAFAATEWFVLSAIAFVGVLSCVRMLAAEVFKETQFHQLKVRAAWLKIKHLRAMRALQEPTGVDIVDDEELTGVDIVEEGVPIDSVDVESPVQEPVPAAA